MPFRRQILEKYLRPGVSVADLTDEEVERLFDEFVAHELEHPRLCPPKQPDNEQIGGE